MDKQVVENLAEVYLNKIQKHYGMSKHHATFPYMYVEDSPYSDAEHATLKGEFCHMENDISIYWKNIETEEDLIRTLLHEYTHYLQSPAWMTRYYKQGYTYTDHPYEIAATQQEENWHKFTINRL
jgi:hypothetical protein